MGNTRTRVLFLDDMKTRHLTFMHEADELDVMVDRVYSAAEAILALKNVEYDQVFLDHDLSEDDIMVEVGGRSKVPTGMAVVDHIRKMAKPPKDVFIHSCNTPAADEMFRRLRECGQPMNLHVIPFPQLIYEMKQARRKRHQGE